MASKKIQFKIATPERIIFQEEVIQITIPTVEGDITILPDHMPLVGILKPGVIEFKRNKEEIEIISVSGGFVEITKAEVVILADTAERAEEINEKRVEEAKKRAEELKRQVKVEDKVNFTEVTIKLEKELARTRAVNKWKRLRGIRK